MKLLDEKLLMLVSSSVLITISSSTIFVAYQCGIELISTESIISLRGNFIRSGLDEIFITYVFVK